MTKSATLALLAPAKVNLYLHVTGKRADGYHLLDSLVIFADHGDLLTVRPAQDLRFESQGRFAAAAGADADNLVLRAARALQAECTDQALGAHVTLQKNLPVAAGIGGGSADAAACLILLQRLWNLSLPEEKLMKIGAGLGADIPVCLTGRASFFSGIGDILQPAPPLPAFHLVLVNPLIPLSTPQVFKQRAGDFTESAAWHHPIEDFDSFVDHLSRRRNDLTTAARAVVPEIADILDLIAGTDACRLARLSGSGATCFGLYRRAGEAAQAARLIRRQRPDWWVVDVAARTSPPAIENR